MSKTVQIDGVRFESTAAIAARFGYSSDYVGRLARSGKVGASQVGRLWFIDPRSFSEYIVMAEEEKKVRAAALKEERRIEREAASLVPVATVHIHQSSDGVLSGYVLAMVQTAMVVCCGFFLGGLGFLVHDQGVVLSDLGGGVAGIAGQFEDLFVQGQSDVQPAAVIYEEIPVAAQQEEVTYAILPVQVSLVSEEMLAEPVLVE